MTWIPSIPSYGSEAQNNEVDTPPSEDSPKDNLVQLEEKHQEKGGSFETSEASPYDGLLDPVTIEQVGYTSTGTLPARTDDGTNTMYSLPLDDVHSWVGSSVDLDVQNLKKLYALNGSFSEGTASGETFYPNGIPDYYPYGWGTQSTSGVVDPEVIQSVSYENSGRKYIVVQSKAKLTNNPQHKYTHYNGTTVYWNQSIDITPTTSNFLLSFNYLYQFGPINGSGPDIPPGNAYIEVIVDGSLVYSLSLYDLTERNSWFSSGAIPISFTPSTNPTTFMIGIKTNSTFTLDADEDYDYTPGADGSSNAEYITVWFDDVSFTAATPPSFDQVDLKLTVEGTSNPITGSNGVGSTTIDATGYWTTNPVNLQVTSNTTVSFEYEAVLRSHRFSNSTWMTDNTKVGVQYTVQAGASPELTFNTYIGFIGGYINLTTRAWFPSDWENVTVFDPFLVDVTSSCSISTNLVEIPTSMMDRLGWWKFNLDAPNYAKSIKSQIFDGSWSEAIPPIFRINNETRANITIGTATETLGLLTNVNVTWFNPSDEIWKSITLLSGGVLGQIYSDSLTFNASSPAGEWRVEVYWSNGTEVAYDMATFEIHHSANLIAIPNEISTDTGTTIKGIVEYRDGDTNDFLLDSVATVEGNWTGSTISFDVNPVRNWWEADFDTSLTGAGVYVIEVKASRPYYDNASCQILVRSTLVTRLTSPNAPWTSDEWGHVVQLTYVYEYYDPVAKIWGPVENISGFVSASVNWSAVSVVEDSPGVYIASLNTSIMDSGTFLINTTFSNLYHQSKQLLLTLIVSQATSSLRIDGEVSARVNISESYPIRISYTHSDGSPILGANVVIDSVSPPTGLQYTPVSEVVGEQGNFTVAVTPQGVGVYTVRFVATSPNSEPASTVFVLVVNDVSTKVEIPTDSVEMGLTDVYNMTFRYEMSNGTGVVNADIKVIYSGGLPGDLSWNENDIGGGNYSIEFSSIASGTYLITIAAYKQYYQRSSGAFFLIVGAISTNLVSLNGTGDTISFGKNYDLFVSYTNETGFGLDNASVIVDSVSPQTGLSWGNTTSHGEGVYSIALTPTDDNLFTILLKANLSNHETRFIQFALNVNPIATTLSVLNSSETISLDQSFTVILRFQDEDSNMLENSTLTIQNPPSGINTTEFDDLGNGLYGITLSPLEVGTFDFVFKASKDGYQSDSDIFTLSAVRVQTTLRVGIAPSSDSLVYGSVYEVVVFYERGDIGQNVSGAAISVQTPTDSLSVLKIEGLVSGYRITFTPLKTGNWTAEISASRDDYEESFASFHFKVVPISISVQFLTPLNVTEGQEFPVTVRLTNSRNGSPIDNAVVKLRFSVSRSGLFEDMNKTSEVGVYTTYLSVPLFANPIYRLEIRVEKENYVLTQPIDETFVILIDPMGRNALTIATSSGVGMSLVAFFVALRIYSGRKRKQLTTDLVNKRRFDDADNLIGAIVLHKKSGIPIYSKIPKGGFDEGIVAAFVSAVTHFREEFEMFDEEQMQVIPISDIIRAVQTRNLICAFITVKSASMEQNRKMEAYAMQVGTYLDDLFEDQPSSMIDDKIGDMLDFIFDTTMDGNLVKYFKVSTSEPFPKRYKLLERLMKDIDMRHCSKPVYLAQGVATYGVTQARGCTLVLEAIDLGLISICEEHEVDRSGIDFKQFFRSSEERANSKA